ncbi:MAG TPA: hypothetical protein VM409_05135 [Chloroflexia bacterium]|nr:hypothetical protein [Chloroflexia bacterium]
MFASSPYRGWAGLYAAMYACYFLVGMGARIGGWMHDDALVYTQSARRVVDGSFHLYAILRNPEIAPPLGATYAYSSYMTILIAPFVGLADALKLGTPWAMRLIAIPLLAGDILAMQQLRQLARSLRPKVDERFMFVGVVLSLFVTSFWLVTAYKSHIEGTVLLFVLLALRFLPRNLLLSGVFAGLALSAKHMTAILTLIPVAAVLLFASRENRLTRRELGGLIDLLRWSGAMLVVFALFLLPPVLSDPSASYYALVTQAGRVVDLGPGLTHWTLLWMSQNLPPGTDASLRPLVLQYSSLLLVAVVALASVGAAWRARTRGQAITLTDARLLGLVAFGAVAYLVLAKWVSDGYYQFPLALIFLWDLVRRAPLAEGDSTSVLQSFPWVGVGAGVLYRCINLLDPGALSSRAMTNAAWYMDPLLLVLFLVIAGLLLRHVMYYAGVPRETRARAAP